MKVILRHSYRGNLSNNFGGVERKLDLPAGENDLSPEIVEHLKRDAPEIFSEAKEVTASVVDKMVKTAPVKKNFGKG